MSQRCVAMRAIVLVLLVCMFLTACMAGKKAKGPGAYALEQDVPQVIAVLPARMVATKQEAGAEQVGVEEKEFVGKLARSVLHNHLAGKGYLPILPTVVDRKLSGQPAWAELEPAELCRLLGVKAVVYLDISGWAMVNAAAVENYMLSGGARMVTAQGREIGTWTETAENQDYSIPTSLIGLAATVAEAVFGDSPRKKFRHAAYDWGWKMAQVMPDCLSGRNLPEIMLVDSNVDVGLFGVGQRVMVKVFAEKDLIGSFDIGDFKRNIPLKVVGEGEYAGAYVVQEGDAAAGQLLTVRMARMNGLESEWVEPEALLHLDGTPPAPPESLTAQARSDGVHLQWALPAGEEVASFVVERNLNPVGEFTQLATIEQTDFADSEVEQGQTYYYRVRSMDKARNLSRAELPMETTMSFFEEQEIGGAVSGTLVSGVYRVGNDLVVPAGEALTLMRGSKLIFAKGVKFLVQGELLAKGEAEAEVVLTGEDWPGLTVAQQGRVTLRHVRVSGASSVFQSQGTVLGQAIHAQGNGGDGVVLSDGSFTLSEVCLAGWDRGVVVNGGKGSLVESVLTGNQVGVAYFAGDMELERNNIHDNEYNIQAGRDVVVRENYFGSPMAAKALLSENVIVQSMLDAPYPHGRILVLQEEGDLSVEERDARFQKHHAAGMELFNARKYGEAYVELKQALRYKADRDASLHLAYAQMELGESEQVEATLEQAIQAFPLDAQLRQFQVRWLLGRGKANQALREVDRALQLDPGNDNLRFLREYVVEQVVLAMPTASEQSR